jgi:hypothetical protein
VCLDAEHCGEVVRRHGNRERVGLVRSLIAASEQADADRWLVGCATVHPRPARSGRAAFSQPSEGLVEGLAFIAFIAEVVPADVANVIRPHKHGDGTTMMRIGSVPDQLRQHEPVRADSSQDPPQCILAVALTDNTQMSLWAQGGRRRSP